MISPREFEDLMYRLDGYYPRTRHDVGALAVAWYRKLKSMDPAVIAQAVDAMPERTPEWFPTLGTMLAECRSIAGKSARAQADKTRQERQTATDAAYDRFLESMPSDSETLLEWVDRAPNAAERLGRGWVVESKLAGHTSNDTISIEEAQARFAALFAAMEEQ